MESTIQLLSDAELDEVTGGNGYHPPLIYIGQLGVNVNKNSTVTSGYGGITISGGINNVTFES